MCTYVEIDYPNVALQKAKFIRNNSMFIDLCTQKSEPTLITDDIGNLKVDQYVILSADITQTNDMEKLLMKFGFDFAQPTIVLCECSLTYVESRLASVFYRWIRTTMKRADLIVYEQIEPLDRFGKIMKEHFQNRSTPLLNIDDFPTFRDQIKRLRSLDYFHVQATPLTDLIAQNYGCFERDRRKRLEPHFDEFEELFLKCSHYSILQGSTYSNPAIPALVSKSVQMNLDERKVYSVTTRPCHPSFRRYGHICFNFDNKTFLFGGCSDVTGRDNILATFDLRNLTTSPIPAFKHDMQETLFSSACVVGNNFYVFGGRSSPEQLCSYLKKIELTKGKIAVLESAGEAPAGRWKHSLNQIDKDNLVLAGGRNMTEVFQDVYAFNVKASKWTRIGEFEDGAFSHSTVTWKKTLIVSGGLSSNETIREDYLKIELNGDKAVIRTFRLPGILPRFSHSSLVHGSKLLLVGGVSYSQEPGLAIIDLDNLNLSREYRLDIPKSVGSYNHALVRSGNKMWIIGGGGNCFSFGMRIGTCVMEINLPDL